MKNLLITREKNRGRNIDSTRDSLTTNGRHDFLAHVLLVVHSIYLLYKSLRSALSYVASTLTGLILTASSRELIKSDISTLNKLPSHLAIIVTQQGRKELLNEVADLAAWTICCSIPTLTIYEARGELKGLDSSVQVAIKRKLRRYFRDTKKISINTPAWDSVDESYTGDDSNIPDLEINILSKDDGRESILEMTKSLCHLVRQNRTKSFEDNSTTGESIVRESNGGSRKMLHPNEHLLASIHKRATHQHTDFGDAQSEVASAILSSKDVTIPFLDAHLSETTISEPNLLLVFSGRQSLEGFPPWSLRLCEICYAGGSGAVTYRAYLQGLRRYARAEMRFGH